MVHKLILPQLSSCDETVERDVEEWTPKQKFEDIRDFKISDRTFDSLKGDLNKLYESTMALAANITELPETHNELINCQG